MDTSMLAPPPTAISTLSLARLLDPEVLGNPYPLYHRLRSEDPVHWDPLLHAWVVTRYADVVTVLSRFSARRTPTPEQLTAMGLSALNPVARVMVRQMLFLDPPAHTRIRTLAAHAFTPRRVESLRARVQETVDELIDAVLPRGRMEVMADLANPLPAMVTARMLGVPERDHEQLKAWSADFAEVLGNFQHNPDRVDRVLRATEGMTQYFRQAMRAGSGGLLDALASAVVDGDRLTEDEVIANAIITMVGGQETTTNLIGNGLLALLRHRDQLERLLDDPSLVSSAVEELLRFESPTQHTARVAPEDVELGGRSIRKRQGVIALLGAANRDPERFADPDRLDVGRQDNRHLAFGWGAHFCFGAPLARIEAQAAFASALRRLPDLRPEAAPLVWRPNLALRGLSALHVAFGSS